LREAKASGSTMQRVCRLSEKGGVEVCLVWGLLRCGRCVWFVGLAGVLGCVNGGLVSVETQFAFSFSRKVYARHRRLATYVRM
jgi:hypothetical protein